ncbi:MAG: isoleucine--tRNA ligase [Clostridiales bacterium]|nr:isoleucine--tRNA ligase [Clostridiales bacterium]
MYKKVSPSFDFVNREMETLDFWKKNDVFKRSIEEREGGEVFTFYEGPPTANGKPHIGHVITRAIKDIIPRYKTMKGYKVLRKAGWDTHGLPVELEVEKALGISGKPQIEEYGVEKFIKACKESVFTYAKEWEDMSDRVGFWADMDNPYITYENDYIESVWWSLKVIWEKGLLYKGHKVVPYCSRCGTALSSHEVAQGYEDVEDPSIYVKMPIRDQDDTYFLVWTTTPWTLPSNLALAVNSKEDYVKVQLENDEKIILARARLEEVIDEEYEILEEMKGEDLVGIDYVPLFDFVELDKKSHYVLAADFVTLTDGSGIVHIAPAFGEEDYQVGQEHDLPFVQLVDNEGKFTDEVEPWKGIFVKDADDSIVEALDNKNRLYRVESISHSYPFCWRCHLPLIYYARDSWFIETTAVKDQLIANNQTINWMPEHIKDGRFGKFLENLIDWGVSRERYWGTPLPLWTCDCGHIHCIGSIEELKEMGNDVPEDIELHKPYIDRVYLNCPECDGKMKRVSEVIDCWYDSGAMPFAQWHYPFENKDIFEENFPADFISEAIDQTRGWFFTLLVISTILFDKSPYKNCITMGLILDGEGQKMSKHRGNVLDPWEVFNHQGADAVRWYFYSSSYPWLPSRFSEEIVSEAQRKFMGTLWNVYGFYVLYADLDKFNPREYDIPVEDRTIMDKWIISKLNSLIKLVDNNLENYKITESARAINEFVDVLSNWYVRRSRERFWAQGMEEDKIAAYLTLYEVLEAITLLVAPFVPFISEEIYQNIVRRIDEDAPLSVHLCDYPTYDENLIHLKLEEDMDIAMDVVSMGRAARNKSSIKVRQPLAAMYVYGKNVKDVSENISDVIKDELNIKELKYLDNMDDYVSYSVKPNLVTVGPKYGRLIPKLYKLFEEDGDSIARKTIQNGQIELDIDGDDIVLLEDDLLIERGTKEGFFMEQDAYITIMLDIRLTDRLIEEGYVRELISKVQTMRKDSGFEVTDRIVLYYYGNELLEGVIERNADQIASQTLTNTFAPGKNEGIDYNALEINSNEIMVAVEVDKTYKG